MEKFNLKAKNGTKICKRLEADSNPNAWLFYNEIYKNDNFFCNYNTKVSKTGSVWDCKGGLNIGQRRLFAKLKVDLQDATNLPFEIGGDCIFNFSSKILRKKKSRFENFEKILKLDNDENRKKEYLDKLELCKTKHHSNVNYCILPITGGLNNYKGNTRAYLESDRADIFIVHVKSYYELKQEFELHNIDLNYLKTTSICNWSNSLNKYFLHFETFENWMKAIYQIDIQKEQELVTKLSGVSKLNIAGSGDLINLHVYIDVALEFWQAREL